MHTRPKYLLVGIHFIVASIIGAVFISKEGNVGELLSGFAGVWVIAGSILLILISAGEYDNFGMWVGIVMLGLSIYASVSSNEDLWFVLAVIDALLIGREMYITGKKTGDDLGDILVIYLTTSSILVSSIIAGIS